MTDQELKAWAAEQLGVARIPCELWRLIPKDIREYARDDEEEREQILLPNVRMLLKACTLGKNGLDPNAAPPTRRQVSEESEALEAASGEYERQRAAAYAEYRAKLAADDPHVRRFREQKLNSDNNLLTLEEAEEFLVDDANLDSLSSISRRLARNYPWNEEQAAWFLLTGEVPEIVPVSGHINRRWGKAHTYGTITLEVQPWISPDIVRDTYIHAQRKALGRNNRRLGDRSLALFWFVVGQAESVHEYNLQERGLVQQRVKGEALGPATDLRGIPSWRVMMARWNEQYSEKRAWLYKEVRNFERDFRNTETQIANPIRA